MRIRLVVGLALAALGVPVVGCSSSSNPYADVSEFCTAYAKAICGVSSVCGFDADTCQTYQQSQCQATASQATASGTRQYTSGNVQPCIDALNAAYSNSQTSVNATTVETYTNLCNKVFVGSAGEGASCNSTFDCALSADVCTTAPGLGSTCAIPTPKLDNDVCADPGDTCPSGDYCAAESGTSRCVAAQALGQSCSATQPCNGSGSCVGGVCAALAGKGDQCGTDADCQSGLFCDTFTSATAPLPQCEDSYQFGGRGSVDCAGFEGTAGTGAQPIGDAGGGPVVNDAGGGG